MSWSAGTATYSAWLERCHDQPSTSSPTANSVTPAPRALTMPARSLPSPDGNVAGNTLSSAPDRMAASPGLMPAARTSTTTWPSAGSGISTSAM